MCFKTNSACIKCLFIIYFFLLYCHGFESDIVSRLLKTQDGYIVENGLQGSEQDVRLEDFFWTGSGDGPPSYVRKPDKTDGNRETILKTVVATVYVDGNVDEDALCMYDCDEPSNFPTDYQASDRRYWLLTVLGGYFMSTDFPIIEQKLATLYRIAFARQQSWHLGIQNDTLVNKIAKRSLNQGIKISPTKQSEYQLQVNTNRIYNVRKRNVENITTSYSSNNENSEFKFNPSIEVKKKIPANNGRKINVIVHNVTQLGEDDYRSDNSKGSKILNQTEIIYSVFVDGKPVLATTAADDMKLVTADEVAQVMDKMVVTKAEPYLKEPQATPLIPAIAANENSNLIAIVSENPFMLAMAIVVLVVLVLLIVGLMLMTRAKRKRSAEIKRLTVRRSLISHQPSNGEPDDTMKKDNNAGIDNIAFDNERGDDTKKRKTGKAVIHFPQPPASSPGSSTSDSSIYYPKRRSRLDIQNILDEKAINLFQKKSKDVDQGQDQQDAIYATIAKKKERKLKHKRKYLAENRVGSVNEDHINSQSCSSSGSDLPHYYEHVEAINANAANHYNRNKLLQDNNFTVRTTPDEDLESPTETYNKEILKALQRNTRSPGSGSIGSFLSMASVRSFPKCTVPEPLSRVLEPVSVTHFDQSDDGLDSNNRIPRVIDAKTKAGTDGGKNEGIFKIDGNGGAMLTRSQSDGADPGVIGPVVWEIHKKQMENKDVTSPFRDPAQTRTRFEGLLEGAIKMYSNDINEEIFNEINSDMTGLPLRPNKDNRGKSALPIRKPGILLRSSSEFINRPVTALPSTSKMENTTQPPSPYKKAWGSGAPSPLVRPLSAGPFHRPEAPIVDVTRVLAPQNINTTTILSTAPLIEAIQNELKKFDKDNNRY